MYKINKDDREEKEYLNISIHTPSKIGRSLAYTSTFNAVNTLIGKITSLRPAMDFITTPNYPAKFLNKGKLTDKDIMKIPTEKVEVINHRAILTHLLFERIYQDKPLFDKLLELDPTIKFTSFNVKKNIVSTLSSKVTRYNEDSEDYVYAISKIFNLLHKHKGNDDNLKKAVKQLIYDMKIDKDKNLFDGVPFEINFDDEQLKAS